VGELFWDLDENLVVESFICDETASSSYVSPPWLECTTLTPSKKTWLKLREKKGNRERLQNSNTHPKYFSCTRKAKTPHRQTIKCILTLPIGEPVLQEQRDLPEVFLREHVLVLYDELRYA